MVAAVLDDHKKTEAIVLLIWVGRFLNREDNGDLDRSLNRFDGGDRL